MDVHKLTEGSVLRGRGTSAGQMPPGLQGDDLKMFIGFADRVSLVLCPPVGC